MNREKDEHFLINRYIELANMACERNIYTCTDFLNMNEIDTFNSIKVSYLLLTLSLQEVIIILKEK